ncbi:MAG TPA: hypothetical protein PKK15_13200 [Kouleothrix sp.]|uniref:hypothetical protein n=1 Tax=Kouleothrix sp. TaxID=2779161 RepID=UPI002D1AA365|nr:hypothetical protein [Kouleothrix sp.]
MLPAVIVGLLVGEPQAPEKAPPAMLGALTGVKVMQGQAGGGRDYQGFQLTFAAERGRAVREDFPLLSAPLLMPGKRVVISVTVQARPRVLLDGIITYQQLAVGDSPELIVTGKDISVLMDMEHVAKRRPGQGAKEAALAILGEYAKYGVRPAASDPKAATTPTEDQRAPIQAATDREHLRQLAAANGFIFCMKPGPTPKQSTAYWGPLELAAPEQDAITSNAGAGTNVAELRFSYDGLAASQLTGAYADPDAAEPVPIQALKRDADTSLAKTQALGGAFVRKRRVADAPFSAAEAGALAHAMANRSADEAVVAEGLLDTARYGNLLFAPGIVGVRGAGETYDGDYYVRSVTHEITPERYTQRFRLSREGPGTLTKTVKAG